MPESAISREGRLESRIPVVGYLIDHQNEEGDDQQGSREAPETGSAKPRPDVLGDRLGCALQGLPFTQQVFERHNRGHKCQRHADNSNYPSCEIAKLELIR